MVSVNRVGKFSSGWQIFLAIAKSRNQVSGAKEETDPDHNVRLQQTILTEQEPNHFTEVPVYNHAA
jgi:hypothetical protein